MVRVKKRKEASDDHNCSSALPVTLPEQSPGSAPIQQPISGVEHHSEGPELASTTTPEYWRIEDDEALDRLVTEHGRNSWSLIADCLPGSKTSDQCRRRWINYLDPQVRRVGWTNAEDCIIAAIFAAYGNQWRFMASCLVNRTDSQIRRRWIESLKQRVESGDFVSNYQVDVAALTDARAKGLPYQPVPVEPNYYHEAGTVPYFCAVESAVNPDALATAVAAVVAATAAASSVDGNVKCKTAAPKPVSPAQEQRVAQRTGLRSIQSASVRVHVETDDTSVEKGLPSSREGAPSDDASKTPFLFKQAEWSGNKLFAMPATSPLTAAAALRAMLQSDLHASPSYLTSDTATIYAQPRPLSGSAIQDSDKRLSFGFTSIPGNIPLNACNTPTLFSSHKKPESEVVLPFRCPSTLDSKTAPPGGPPTVLLSPPNSLVSHQPRRTTADALPASAKKRYEMNSLGPIAPAFSTVPTVFVPVEDINSCLMGTDADPDGSPAVRQSQRVRIRRAREAGCDNLPMASVPPYEDVAPWPAITRTRTRIPGPRPYTVGPDVESDDCDREEEDAYYDGSSWKKPRRAGQVGEAAQDGEVNEEVGGVSAFSAAALKVSLTQLASQSPMDAPNEQPAKAFGNVTPLTLENIAPGGHGLSAKHAVALLSPSSSQHIADFVHNAQQQQHGIAEAGRARGHREENPLYALYAAAQDGAELYRAAAAHVQQSQDAQV